MNVFFDKITNVCIFLGVSNDRVYFFLIDVDMNLITFCDVTDYLLIEIDLKFDTLTV